MNISLEQITLLIDSLPYAAEVYDNDGKLIAVNKVWKNIWHYHSSQIPQTEILSNSLILKAGIIDNLKKIFTEGGTIRTQPIICEVGDNKYSEFKVESVFKFYIYSVHDSNNDVAYVINLIEDVTDELKGIEAEKEEELKKRNSIAVFEMLEKERKRVSQELHDVIGQKILLAKLNIELFQKKTGEKSLELSDSIKNLIDISKEVKNIIHSLHPVVIEKYSLIDSLDLLIHEFSDSSGIKTQIKYYGNPEYENINIDLNIYRIIQESLNNAAKHSGANKVEIECHFTEKIFICSVHDDGCGFDQKNISKSNSKRLSYGIISMKERAFAFGGDLTIDSTIGKGTKIYFQIPTVKEII